MKISRIYLWWPCWRERRDFVDFFDGCGFARRIWTKFYWIGLWTSVVARLKGLRTIQKLRNAKFSIFEPPVTEFLPNFLDRTVNLHKILAPPFFLERYVILEWTLRVWGLECSPLTFPIQSIHSPCNQNRNILYYKIKKTLPLLFKKGEKLLCS